MGQRYKVELYPPYPDTGMMTGKIPSGVKITDAETGEVAICTKHRSQHLNKDECIRRLRDKDRNQ